MFADTQTKWSLSPGLLRAGDFRGCPQMWQDRDRQPSTIPVPQPGCRAAGTAPDIRNFPEQGHRLIYSI